MKSLESGVSLALNLKNLGLCVRAVNLDATFALGESVGRAAVAGSVVTLDGDLGAGKTAMTRGIASGLGIDPDEVSSPTFTLQQHYGPGTRGLVLTHDDAYRLADGESFVMAGLDESLSADGVTVIEWASLVDDVLGPVDYRVTITRCAASEVATVDAQGSVVLPTDDAVREILVVCVDADRLNRLIKALPPMWQEALHE